MNHTTHHNAFSSSSPSSCFVPPRVISSPLNVPVSSLSSLPAPASVPRSVPSVSRAVSPSVRPVPLSLAPPRQALSPIHVHKKDMIHFLNINGIRNYNKKLELTSALHSAPRTAFVALVEAKIRSASDVRVPSMRGYNNFAFPHKHDSSGIVCYSAVPCRVLRKACVNVDGSMAQFFALSLFGGKTVCVGVVYLRPPVHADVLAKVLALIERMLRLGYPLLLLGDFNCRHPQFGDRPDLVPTASAKTLAAFLESNALVVLNTRDTFGEGTRDISVLDLAITTEPGMFGMRLDDLPIESDHSTISITCNDPRFRPPPPSSDKKEKPLRWRIPDGDLTPFHDRAQSEFSRASLAFDASSYPGRGPQDVVDAMADSFSSHVVRRSMLQAAQQQAAAIW